MLLISYKKYLAAFLFIFICASGLAKDDVPHPAGRVNDFAGVLSPEYIQKIDSLAGDLEQKTTAEIAVVTVNSISPYDEIEYARLLFDNWRPGKKGKDNGVLILLAINQRRWRIETGYGVEGVLPDSLCGQIGRQFMAPYFKKGRYGEGLYQGAAAVAKAINGEPLAADGADRETFASAIFIIVLIVGFLMFRIFIFSPWLFFSGYGGGGFGGGGGGGGFGGFGGGGGGGGGAGGGW